MTKPPQHDAHCDAFDEHLWQGRPPSEDQVAYQALVSQPVTAEVTEERYVVCRSDGAPVNTYWSEITGWGQLQGCTEFSRQAMLDHGEPVDGFWTTLERAQELEQ